ncbi:hypothetical protein [Microlunatus soli]|uniref:PknH-like extracellular domain-containing protein n=1 Tax=Microlunatus soli TaxID=630515 RepID=A0A1H2AH61_9ACTN|nr:hypothetical protein [Microlunatus soli]SDT45311.1 hypothetical protein SAMN04489812_5937 [Microlunatus soli]
MRRSVSVGCWIAAVVLGAGTGHFVLPDRGTVGWPPWSADSTTPPADGNATAGPEPMPSDYARTPPTKSDLASVKTFDKAGLDVRVYHLGGDGDPNTGATICSDQAGPGNRTLGDLTGYDPSLTGSWEEKGDDGTADQMIAVADSPADAKVAADQLLNSESPCRHAEVGESVLGKPREQLIEPGVWAAWIGQYPGDQNTNGEAPEGAEPCGGEIIIRNGQRFGTIGVYLCADSEQLGTLAVAAAKRLG